MAGRYSGSYLDRWNGWRAAATLADFGRASLAKRIPSRSLRLFLHRDNQARHAHPAAEPHI
jgi:hypothetical protein